MVYDCGFRKDIINERKETDVDLYKEIQASEKYKPKFAPFMSFKTSDKTERCCGDKYYYDREIFKNNFIVDIFAVIVPKKCSMKSQRSLLYKELYKNLIRHFILSCFHIINGRNEENKKKNKPKNDECCVLYLESIVGDRSINSEYIIETINIFISRYQYDIPEDLFVVIDAPDPNDKTKKLNRKM